MLGPAYVASTMGGVVTGMIVGDSLGAIPQAAAVPATSSSAAPKVTAEGTPVSGNNVTARQTVFMSAGYVIAAMAILLLGSRFLRDARIG